jgi:hypothetical protein
MQFQDWMFDKRVLDRNIRKGVIDRGDYAEYLKSLPDVSDNVAPLEEPEDEADADAEGEDAPQGDEE